MSTFEEHLIEKIHPEVSPFWAVADGDGLFRSDSVNRLLTERGIEVLIYEDPMAFRFRYEHQIRPRIKSGHSICYVIVLEPGPDGFYVLPADVLNLCHQIEVTISGLFPTLARSVLVEQDAAMLGKLWDKRDQFPATTQGERDTADLVLRIGYRVETSFIGNFQDLVHILIDLNFSGHRLSEVLAKRLEEVVGSSEINLLDLHRIVRNPAAFWQFLQNEWEGWVCPENEKRIRDFVFPSVDFTEDRIKVRVDNLFLDGILQLVPGDLVKHPLPQSWCQVGIASLSTQLSSSELADQRKHLIEEIPKEDAGYKDWQRFAQSYSAHVAAAFGADMNSADIDTFWNSLWRPVDEHFRSFMENRMESLVNLPPTRPVMTHHIPHFLAREVKAGRKVALLVLDGLSLAQWKVVRRVIEESMENILISDDSCFTLVPSVTNVCRQSIYAGELPVFFESTITRTDSDQKRWKSFWDGACGRTVRCAHFNVEGQDTDLPTVLEALHSTNQAIGITIRMPDEIVHGATMGWRGISTQLDLWSRSQFLQQLIEEFIDDSYELFVTSDHGNIEAVGEGSLSQGVLADRTGQRMRVYTDETILKSSLAELGERAICWDSKLLPTSYKPLIHEGRGAFIQKGQSLVCHGGASLDEIVVPFVHLTRPAKL